jgi:hypothetical protein
MAFSCYVYYNSAEVYAWQTGILKIHKKYPQVIHNTIRVVDESVPILFILETLYDTL